MQEGLKAVGNKVSTQCTNHILCTVWSFLGMRIIIVVSCYCYNYTNDERCLQTYYTQMINVDTDSHPNCFRSSSNSELKNKIEAGRQKHATLKYNWSMGIGTLINRDDQLAQKANHFTLNSPGCYQSSFILSGTHQSMTGI